MDHPYSLSQWSSPIGVDPNVAKNGTGQEITENGILHPTSDFLSFHPGPNGEFSVVRWTAPVAGTYHVASTFKSLRFEGSPTTSDVHVLHNSSPIFDALINGLISSGDQSFSTTLTLNAGDTVDFVVGFGENLDYNCDSTGLKATILLPTFSGAKSVSPTTASRGDPLTYTIEIRNGGAISLTNVLATDTLPSALTYIENSLSATSGSTGYANGVITWTGTLSTGGIVTLTYGARISHTARMNTSITNSAVISDASETFTSTATVHIPPAYVFLPLCTHDYCPDYFDNFSNSTSGWEVGDDAYARSEYMNGEYRVLTKRSGYTYVFDAPTCNRQNYAVEADARWVGTPGAAYSLLFGIAGDFSQYYLFDVNTDYQLYWLVRRDPGVWVTLVDATSSPAIHSGTASNHLKATRSGSQITLEVNGTVLGTWDDSAISGLTGAGLASIPYRNLPTSDARFDNFRITNLGSDAIQQGSINTDTKAGSSQIIPHGFPRVVTFDSQ
jgi:uncharacterized repeat protein (TIGR01451 family)